MCYTQFADIILYITSERRNDMHKIDEYGEILIRNIGDRLKYLRKHYAVQVDRLAEALGVSRNQYYLYEQGATALSVIGLKRIADFYHVSLEFLTNNHLPELGSATFFHCYTIDSINELVKAKEVYISNRNDSLIFVKNKEKFMLFETMQNCPNGNGIYFFELEGVKKIAMLLFVNSPSDKNGMVLAIYSKDSQVSIRRKDIFIMARHIGDYVETIPGRFIEQ